MSRRAPRFNHARTDKCAADGTSTYSSWLRLRKTPLPPVRRSQFTKLLSDTMALTNSDALDLRSSDEPTQHHRVGFPVLRMHSHCIVRYVGWHHCPRGSAAPGLGDAPSDRRATRQRHDAVDAGRP